MRQSGKRLIPVVLLVAATLAFARAPDGWLARPIFGNAVFHWSVDTPGGVAAYSGRLFLGNTTGTLLVWQGYEVQPNETLTTYTLPRPGCRPESFAVPEVCAYLLVSDNVIGVVNSRDPGKLWRGQEYLLWITTVRR